MHFEMAANWDVTLSNPAVTY